MTPYTCPFCGSTDLAVHQVALMEVNTSTMESQAPEHITELECRACGWTGAPQQATSQPAHQGNPVSEGSPSP